MTKLNTAQAPITDWQNVSGPSQFGSSNGQAFTNTTISHLRYKRSGDSASFSGRVTFTGTPGTGTGALGILVAGFSLDTAKLADSSYRGKAKLLVSSTTSYYFDVQVGIFAGGFAMYFIRSDGAGVSNQTFQPVASIPTSVGNGDFIEFECLEVPIVGYSSNVVMGDRAVEEYAYSTDVSATGTVTGSGFANGSVGQLFSASWATGTTYIRRVRFQTAIQPTDSLVLEVGRGGLWAPIEEFVAGASSSRQGSYFYGASVDRVIGSSTDVDVYFENGGFRPGTTYGAIGDAWSSLNASAFSWRIRKVSSGAMIGYPISPVNLMNIGGVPLIVPNTTSWNIADAANYVRVNCGTFLISRSASASTPFDSLSGSSAIGYSGSGYPAMTYNARFTGTNNTVYREGADTWSYLSFGQTTGSPANTAFSFHAQTSGGSAGNVGLDGTNILGYIMPYGAWVIGRDDNITGNHFIRMGSIGNTGSFLQIQRSGSTISNFTYVSANTSLNISNATVTAPSDERLKQDFRDFDALAIATKIGVYDFEWIASGERSLGVKAQELYKILPHVVKQGDDKAPWTVDYAGLVPVLLRSIQQLEARLKVLEG